MGFREEQRTINERNQIKISIATDAENSKTSIPGMHLLIRSVLFSQYLLCCHFEETYTLVTLPQDCLSSEIQFSWKRT